MNDWFDDRVELLWKDDAGCPDDPWTMKRACPHCVAVVLREAYKVGEGVMLDRCKAGLEEL